MNQVIQPNIARIMRHWGLAAKSWEPIKDVFKVQTDYGYKNLKVSPLKPERLVFVHAAIAHLLQSGFSKMYPYIPTLDGNTYVTDNMHAYTLFDWIEGRQCDFRNQHELTQATTVFAQFHRCSYGFEPPNRSNMRNQLGKCIMHFGERQRDLLQFRDIAHKWKSDPFAALFLENIDFYLAMAKEAIKRIEKTPYEHLVSEANLLKPFSHGDPAARNFILTPEQEVYMIDFDSCRVDLPLMDLIKFMRRVMKKYQWNSKIAMLIMDSYQSIIPLNAAEIEVIKAVLYFPQKFWRMSIRYFHQHGRHSQERSLQKFSKYLQSRTAFARFHSDFNHYQHVGDR